MPILRVKASTVVPAPAAVCYELIADYHKGHPSILPPQYFENLEVLEGGRGAGTRIRFTMIAYGKRTDCRARVTEPEPGRVLVETDEATGTTTHFTVEPVDGGKTRVTFDTAYPTSGLKGLIERFVVPRYLATVYAAELKQLSERAVAAIR